MATAAGKAIKKCVLELGGSDPFIVMPSADLDKAVDTAVQARVINNGQSCIAAKRFIVHQQIAEQFEKKFVDRMASLKVGDPMEAATDVGPLATEDVLKGLEEQVQKTIEKGARVLLEESGLIAKVISLRQRCSLIFRKVRLLSTTSYLALWRYLSRKRHERCDRDCEQFYLWLALAHGRTMLPNVTSSSMRLNQVWHLSMEWWPLIRAFLSAVKQSGYGRELGHHGILEFVNVKLVCVQVAEPAKPRASRNKISC